MKRVPPDAPPEAGLPRPLEWSRIRHLHAIVPAHVIFRSLASEMVLLNIDTGKYHSMDEVGARCFEALRESDNLETALGTLVEEYEAPEDTIRKDLVGYCSELLDYGLIELRRSNT